MNGPASDAPYGNLAVSAFAAAVGDQSPAPASGSALAVSAALAASLAELTARVLEDDVAVRDAVELRSRLLAIADEDAAVYTAFMAERNDETRSRTVDVPLELAEASARVAALAADLEQRSDAALAGDARAAVELSRAVVRAAATLVAINLAGRDDPRGVRARQLATAS
jgi:methenyltetrahydrofolate cyclohydrolase